ncbi:MAG: CcmD family protein [Chitinophagaceae bacterium]|nr:CcmD family protein [Chitinophagaceae bacterium]
MQAIKSIVIVVFFLLTSVVLLAQDAAVQPENVFTSNGKLGVVVAVLVTILAGIIFYLVSLDKKISQLEKKK